ncbi:MAG: zf-HC2 domain-containing protein [candidate division WOR-3 bacterium]|nr:MAG: zf-HC2 domain-containing protein [candidate division WOR-3 bacterium]
MKCDLPIELLSGYLDGELNEQDRAKVETHLKDCKACKQQLMALEKINRDVRDGVYEEPTPEFNFGLKRRVMDRIRPAPRRSLFRFAPIFAPVAAAILILVVFIDISPSKRIVGMTDQIAYKKVATRQQVQISIPEPEITQAPAPVTATRMAKAAQEMAPSAEFKEAPAAGGIAETRDEMADIDEAVVATHARAQVVRAIIDTTGTIIKVATGNTLIPEKDTVLEKELAGQQLAPPTIEGKKKQVYFELATTEEGDEKEQ